MIVLLFISAAIGGIAIGLHFKVLALAPAIVLGAAVVIATMAHHHNALAMLLGLFETLTLLQFGYVVGSVLQTYWPAQVGALLHRHSWLPTRY
jgi:hypothetical protein